MIIRSWSFSLEDAADDQGVAFGGFPYIGPLRFQDTSPDDQEYLVLGHTPTLAPDLDLLFPLPAPGLWNPAVGGVEAIPLPGASPSQHMDRVARATPSPHVQGRVLALGHFLAAFEEAFLDPNSPSRGHPRGSFSRCRHLLEALLFDWHPFEHGEDHLALSRHIRAVRARHA